MNRFGRQIFFLVFLTGLVCRLPAQSPSLYFDKLTNQNGLSNNKVNCILQDARGFIWFGTDDGLNRYDGNNFTIFRNQPGNPFSISGNMIMDLLEDKNGILWIATSDGGLTKYDYRISPRQQFVQFKHLPADTNSIPVNMLNALLEDQQGNLWIATSGAGVLKFDKEKRTFLTATLGRNSTCLDLEFDENGMIWVGRQGGGIIKINPRTHEFSMDPRYHNLYAKLPHTSVTALYADEEKNMWFGSWDKVLYRYNRNKNAEEIFQKNTSPWSFSNDEIISFRQDKTYNLWMGGRNGGLHVYNKKRDQFYSYRYDPSREGTIADNTVNCIFIDRSGVVWIGTNKGVSIHNPSQQQFQQTFISQPGNFPKDIVINDFYKDQSDNLWIASTEGIFFRKAGESNLVYKQVVYKGNKLNVSKFFYDKDGTFYLGTNYSIFVYDAIRNKVDLLLNTEKDSVMNKIIASRVVSIVKDSIDGRPVLLVSPYGHYLAYYDLTEKKWTSRMDSVQNIISNFNIKDNLIRKIYKTSSGKIWLATVKEGLGEWVKNSKPRIKYYKNDPFQKEVLSNNHVFDIVENNLGHLWITTYGGGLHYFNPFSNKISHVSATNNLLEGVQIDSRGYVWMIGNGNLHRYDPGLGSYTSFDLPDIEKSGGIRGYIYKDAQGKMYVGGTNYFIEFNPITILPIRGKPKVFFTDFKIFNNSFSDLLNQRNISLNYNQNYFTIEFAAPHYTSATPVQYAYQLEGVDDNWIEAGTRNSIPYSNLPGGEYTFNVKATNNPGNWNEETASIHITIIPPFWKTWWFYLFCGIVAILITYALYRYRINELLKRQAIRNKIAQDLHDNMGSTLSSISVYSQVAKIQQAKGNHQVLEDVLGKIASTSSEMISEMNDIVWAINPRNDSMEKILQRMDSFAKPLLAVKNIQFALAYSQDVLNVNLEMQKRKNFYLIFKESINNSLKYSECSSLTVNIKIRGNHLELIVQDNGIGFEKEKIVQSSQSLSGNGLRNMEMRAKEMKGACSIESQAGKGTSIHLWFPIP
ncbi:MAG: histidine kinase [Chitinophagaceae bacterium]|nr:histidine kinase [Chitinophagaceae bacterium]